MWQRFIFASNEAIVNLLVDFVPFAGWVVHFQVDSQGNWQAPWSNWKQWAWSTVPIPFFGLSLSSIYYAETLEAVIRQLGSATVGHPNPQLDKAMQKLTVESRVLRLSAAGLKAVGKAIPFAGAFVGLGWDMWEAWSDCERLCGAWKAAN